MGVVVYSLLWGNAGFYTINRSASIALEVAIAAMGNVSLERTFVSVCGSTCVYVFFRSIYLPSGLFMHLFMYLSIYLSIYLSVYLSIQLSNYRCIYLSIQVYTCAKPSSFICATFHAHPPRTGLVRGFKKARFRV